MTRTNWVKSHTRGAYFPRREIHATNSGMNRGQEDTPEPRPRQGSERDASPKPCYTLRIGIRQRFVLDEVCDENGNPVPVECLRPYGWVVGLDVEENPDLVPKFYAHESIQVGLCWADIEHDDHWSFVITTEVDL
jgi:hypothetical protein